MKFKIGDQIYVNEPESLWHGNQGAIVSIRESKPYPYEVQMRRIPYTYWFPEQKLCTTPVEPVEPPAPKKINPPAFKNSSRPAPVEYVEPIFGIGAINLGDGAEVQTPWPKYGTICCKCGQSESDGAMFTTLAGGNICDDCFG